VQQTFLAAANYLTWLREKCPWNLPYGTADNPSQVSRIAAKYGVFDVDSVADLTVAEHILLGKTLKNYNYTNTQAFTASKVGSISASKADKNALRLQTCKFFHILPPDKFPATKKRKVEDSKNLPNKSAKTDSASLQQASSKPWPPVS